MVSEALRNRLRGNLSGLVIVAVWGARAYPDAVGMDAALALFLDGDAAGAPRPHIGEYRFHEDGFALTVSARPLTDADRRWIQGNWRQGEWTAGLGYAFILPEPG